METHQVLRTALALLFKRALGRGTDLKNGAFLLLSFQQRNDYTSGRGISLQSLQGRPPGGMCGMQAALPRPLPAAGAGSAAPLRRPQRRGRKAELCWEGSWESAVLLASFFSVLLSELKNKLNQRKAQSDPSSTGGTFSKALRGN